jgi:hypothetical protein
LLDDTGTLIYNPSTGLLTSTTFSGNLTGNVTGNILDSNGNELVKGTATASAVNEITVTNAATGNGPTISASGDDVNVDLNLKAKGTGAISIGNDAIAQDINVGTGAAARTVTIGNTTGATAINLTSGSGGINTSGALNVGGTLDVTGDTSVSTFDSSGATSLATGGGVVNIASTGVMTTVKGTLNVDEAVTLDATLDVTGGVTGDVNGNVTGNADTATLASTVSINYSSSDADAETDGTEYSSTASLASGTRTFLRGSLPFFSSNTFNAGINLSTNSIITISTTSPAYSTQGGTTLPLQVLISSINDTNNTFTISTYNWNGSAGYQLTAPDINFTFNFQIFK